MLAVAMPNIFSVTTRLRSAIFAKLPICADASMGPALSKKNLNYLLRVALTDRRFYEKIDEELPQKVVDDTKRAMHNLSRLMKHIDMYNSLPKDEIGILRCSYSYQISLYIPESSLAQATLTKEIGQVTRIVSQAAPPSTAANGGLMKQCPFPLSMLLPNRVVQL